MPVIFARPLCSDDWMTLASEMCGIRCCANDAASREGGMPQTFVVYGPKKSPYSVLPIACFTQSSEETSFRGRIFRLTTSRR